MAVTQHARNNERLSLDQLAREFGVHKRTLRAAARTGRLEVTFSRSAFGRPIRLATRAAVQAFMRKDYRRYGGQSPAVAPLPSVPEDYDKRLRRRIRAANKAVVYQWESRKRTPSPVFWKRVEALGGAKLDARRTPTSSKRPAHLFDLLPTGGCEQPTADR
jgi:ribosome-binding protein aMBF1 (putative translation factor)